MDRVKAKTVYLREVDRFEDSCDACDRLQKFAPGKRCLDCVDAAAWAKTQVKVSLTDPAAEPDELELVQRHSGRCCSNRYCQHEGGPAPLPPGYFNLCPECLTRKSVDLTPFHEAISINMLTQRKGSNYRE